MRRFEHQGRFWEIEPSGKWFTVRFGKVGSAGQTQVKDFPDEARAEKEYDKIVREKTNKGYVEVS